MARLRRLVNSGRLSQPFTYADSPIVVAAPRDAHVPQMGAVAPDAACRLPGADGRAVWLGELLGTHFMALLVSDASRVGRAAAIRASRLAWPAPCDVVAVGPDAPLAGLTVLADPAGEARRVYGRAGPSAYLIRPDGHLAAWVPLPHSDAVDALPGLMARAIGA
jgi:3-(3-hydroxy-phenyl)propionate hydroxylase